MRRYGRKRTLVASQLGLMVVGVAIGVAPSYAVLAVFKFLVGCFQQVGELLSFIDAALLTRERERERETERERERERERIKTCN